MCAPNLAILVRKRTTLGGRRNRGRFYLPFMASEDDVAEGGFLLATPLADTQAACDDFMTELNTRDCPMFLLHADGGSPTPVVQLEVQRQCATQRRRMRR